MQVLVQLCNPEGEHHDKVGVVWFVDETGLQVSDVMFNKVPTHIMDPLETIGERIGFTFILIESCVAEGSAGAALRLEPAFAGVAGVGTCTKPSVSVLSVDIG